MKNSTPNAIIQRVRLLRNKYSGRRGKSKFARALRIKPSTYSYYEKDRVPPIKTLLKIAEVAGADLNWLLTGRETAEISAFRPRESALDSDKSLEVLSKKGAAKPDKALADTAVAGKTFPSGPNKALAGSGNAPILQKLDALLAENPHLTEPILAFFEILREKKGVESRAGSEVTQLRKSRPGWIPVLGRTAAGIVHFWDMAALPTPKQAVTELEQLVKKHIGKAIVGSSGGTMSIDLQARPLVDSAKVQQANLIQVGGQEADQIVEFVECEEIFQLFPDSFALQVDGDSMSPRINDGDIVILSPSVQAAQGQIAIARVKNQIGVTCKLIRSAEKTVHLIPINEKYEAKLVAKEDLLWALAVLCHISV